MDTMLSNRWRTDRANLYISASFGKAEVAATDHIDSTYIGFAAGEDDNYVLTFTSLIGDSLYLQDTENDSVLAITEGGRYVFYATPKTDNSNRFRVLTERPQRQLLPCLPMYLSLCATPNSPLLYIRLAVCCYGRLPMVRFLQQGCRQECISCAMEIQVLKLYTIEPITD